MLHCISEKNIIKQNYRIDGGARITTESGKTIETDMVIVSAGVRPNTELVKNKWIKLGNYGGIIVNEKMEFSFIK